MEIRRFDIPTQTIEAFAAEHGLVMEVHERRKPVGDPDRYYARFKDAEIGGDGVLCGAYGNGETPALAIAAYAREISLSRLVIRAYHDDRRDIQVPRLYSDPQTDA